jgi:hypothetical protein
MSIVKSNFLGKRSLLIISIIQFFSLGLSFVFGILSYKTLNVETYANWVIILTVINSVFVLTSFGNDIFILKALPKEDVDLPIFSEILSFRLIGAFFLMVPIFIYLLISLINPGFFVITLFYLYLIQKLYIDVLSSYYKLSGRIANAITLTLIFDLLIRIGVLMFFNKPTIELFLFSVVLLNMILLIFTPIILVKDIRIKLRELRTYLNFNFPLYFNSIVVFLLFNSDVLIAPIFLHGDLLAGYLFGKSIFLAFKSLIDLFFETKIIEHCKSRYNYLNWVTKFFLFYSLVLLILFVVAWFFLDDLGQLIPKEFLGKIRFLIPFASVLISSLILFPLFRHYYAFVLVFCDVRTVSKSNYLTIGLIIFFGFIVFLNKAIFIYYFPAVLFLYIIVHYVLYRLKYLEPRS